MHKPDKAQSKQDKAQSKPDKAQCLLLWQALQETQSQGAVASKDGKRYLRSK